jgi:hypothetical protein
MSDRGAMRGVVLCEDKLTEQFARKLLSNLGFDTRRRIRFARAPAGEGSGEAWVRQRYPREVRELRSKRHQRDLCLLAIRDGDRFGTDVRKRELDEQLVSTQLAPRQATERIATPVPTWSIESWILSLLGETELHEREPAKAELVRRHGERIGEAIAAAARAWCEGAAAASGLPSLRDGVDELARLSK